MDEVFTVLRVVVSLAVVVGVIWFVQRKFVRSSGKKSRKRSVSIVARQSVGNKSSVAVIEFQGKQFLVGVTEHSISVLDSAPLAEEATEPVAVSTPATTTFSLPHTSTTAMRPITRRSSSKQFAAALSAAIESAPAGETIVMPIVEPALPAEVAPVAPARAARTRTPLPDALAASLRKHPEPGAPLGGSILSGATWKQAFSAIKGER